MLFFHMMQRYNAFIEDVEGAGCAPYYLKVGLCHGYWKGSSMIVAIAFCNSEGQRRGKKGRNATEI